jgi:hypothetical protein
MAFHQPTRQAVQRAVRPAAEDREGVLAQSSQQTHDQQQQQQLDQSQTWVLFSPATTTSEYSEVEPSVQTPGRSRISDLGSLHTTPRSEQLLDASSSINEEDIGEDDAELDSLDSHLPSFRSLPGLSVHSQHAAPNATPVLPAHDGLGSFQLDHPVSGLDAQNQIYQFERFNPRRIRRRRESLEYAASAMEPGVATEDEKRARIEAWRLEHSRVLLDEVQKETRRRRRSQVSVRQPQTASAVSALQPSQVLDEAASDMTWHDEDAMVSEEEPSGFLTRFTQKIIKDILGIDDRMLSVLLGEVIPDEDDLSTTPRASELIGQPAGDDAALHERILEKVSRELGLLVNQITHHPGAFTAYSRLQTMPIPYAGLPVIPEAGAAAAAEGSSTAKSEPQTSPDFKPTVHQNTQPIDILGRSQSASTPEDVHMGGTFTKDEWEQDLDIKLVFRYIRSRFSSRTNASPQSSTTHLATSTSQDAAAKVARVRQHHPLISRSRPVERRSFKATTPGSPVALRHQSSCASQSTRRSARRSSVSSRHYWDIGGSLGTGSVIASNGPMGSWGEV